MKYVKSFRANNISDLDETEIRTLEFLFQHTKYDDAGHPVELTTHNPDGSIEHVYKYQYNDEGKAIDELLFEDNNELTEHRSMEYNAEGQLIKENIHYLDGTSDQLIFKYDNHGHMISKRSIDSDGETGNYLVNVYNGNLLTSETEYDIAGEIITQRKIIYDDEGNITEEVFRTPEEDYRILYSYDKNGKASVRRRYNAEKHLTERNTFTYDTDGRLAESMEETSSGIEITYSSYDDAGNIILQEEKSEDGELLSRIQRSYDEQNRPLTTTYMFQKPTQMAPVNYRIRLEYE